MKKITGIISIVLLVTSFWGGYNLNGASAKSKNFVPGDVIVKFKPGIDENEIAQFYAQYGLNKKHDLDKFRNDSRKEKLFHKTGKPADVLAEELNRDVRVDYAEPNFFASLNLIPNDTSFSEQYDMRNLGQPILGASGTPGADIKASEAWDITTGSASTIVGVIDSGVDITHPELVANIWTNPGEIPGNGIDDDGNGFIDDVHGISTLPFGSPVDVADLSGHGTHVSGTIGAVGNNNSGIAGINWSVRILPCRAFDANGSGTVDQIVRCFQYLNFLKNVKNQNILVTSNSWEVADFSQALKDAMSAVDQPGMQPMLHVNAAGNSNIDTSITPNYPAGFHLPNSIIVAATDNNDLYANFSNFGATSVHLAAPGVNIFSTVPINGCALFCVPGGYNYISGTSMATPHVSGSAALVWSVHPGFTAGQIKDQLLNSVDPLPAQAKQTITNGRLNVFRALDNIAPPAPVVPTITSTPITTALVNQVYNYQASASGTSPIIWSLTVGPVGMTINSSTGLVSWTPIGTGNFPVQIKAVNTAGITTQSYSISVSAPIQTVILNVTDGWDSKAGKTLSAQGKVGTVQTSDNNRLSIGANSFMSFQFDNIVPVTANITSVKVSVEHYEDTSMATGALTWQNGGSPLNNPIIFGSLSPTLILGQANEAVNVWDITSFITSPARANDLKFVIRNADPKGKNSFVDRLFVTVQYQ